MVMTIDAFKRAETVIRQSREGLWWDTWIARVRAHCQEKGDAYK